MPSGRRTSGVVRGAFLAMFGLHASTRLVHLVARLEVALNLLHCAVSGNVVACSSCTDDCIVVPANMTTSQSLFWRICLNILTTECLRDLGG